MKKGQGFMLVYSIASKQTIKEIEDMINSIHRIKDSVEV